MQRAGEDVARGALFDDAARVEHGDIVGNAPDHSDVVGDEDDGGSCLALQILEEVENLGLDGDVEGSRRFVGDEHFGPGGEGAGNDHPLALPSAHLVGVLSGRFGWIGDAHLPQHVDGPRPGRFP
jgi:hypothetical protein